MRTHRVVVAYDGSEGADDALDLGAWIASSTHQIPLVVCVYPDDVVPVLPGIGADWLSQMRSDAQSTLTRAKKRLAGRSPLAEFQAVPGSSAAHGLDAIARRTGASGMVIGSSHRGPLRRVASSHTADRLLQGASYPVLVAPRGMWDRALDKPLSTVGCAFLPTPEGTVALNRAADLSRRSGARLEVFVVASIGPEHALTAPRLRNRLSARDEANIEDTIRTELAADGSGAIDVTVHVLEGRVVDTLAALDERDAQVLVCGSRGYGPAGRVLLGGVSSRLIRRASTPVMVVPRSSPEHVGTASESDHGEAAERDASVG